jgi:hypothetical protein
MENTSSHNEIIKNVILIILDFVPEVTLLLNFKALNRNLRKGLEYPAYNEIWHKNSSKVRNDFIV